MIPFSSRNLIRFAAEVPIETIVFVRSAVALPFFLPRVFCGAVQLSLKKIPGHLVRSLAGLTALYCYIYSVKTLPLVNAITLGNTAPLFIPLIVLIWLKLVISKKRMLAILIGFVGVVILLRPASLVIQFGNLTGLATGFFGAIALLQVRQLSRVESTETILVYYFLITTVIAFFPMILAWEPIPTRPQWLDVLLIGVFAMVFQYALTKCYTHAPASKAGTMSYLSVLFGAILGWAIFSETLDYWILLGAVLIIIGACLTLFDRTPPRKIRGFRWFAILLSLPLFGDPSIVFVHLV